ncbi:MAG: hypothetical protein JSW73_02515 [Candidatus Woesearchaeota archaeon]|nr:MAG: hypothetical protein JSW73_02515 [Candidatus Woesearchaeota archaeon]
MKNYLVETLRAEKLDETNMWGKKTLGMQIHTFLEVRGQHLGQLHTPSGNYENETQDLFLYKNGAVLNLAQHMYTSKRDFPFHDEDIEDYDFQGFSDKEGRKARVRVQIFSTKEYLVKEAKKDLESKFSALATRGK